MQAIFSEYSMAVKEKVLFASLLALWLIICITRSSNLISMLTLCYTWKGHN